MEPIFLLLLLLLGSVAGFMAGLLGVGGGIVLVPGLYAILSYIQMSSGFDPSYIMHVSVGTSLAIIVPTGLSSAYAHYKRASVDFGMVRQIGIGIVFGVCIGTALASKLSGQVLQMIFASVIVVLAGVMIMKGKVVKLSEAGARTSRVNAVTGVGIGLVSTLIGIGGATISVPYMVMRGVVMQRAVGTASALGLVIAIPAAIGFVAIGWSHVNLPPFSIGYVNILAWSCIVPASVLMAPVGAKYAHALPKEKLRIVFAVFMVLVALNMWRKIIMG